MAASYAVAQQSGAATAVCDCLLGACFGQGSLLILRKRKRDEHRLLLVSAIVNGKASKGETEDSARQQENGATGDSQKAVIKSARLAYTQKTTTRSTLELGRGI